MVKTLIRILILLILVFPWVLIVGSTSKCAAAVYQVGPAKSYKTLQEIAGLLDPGDLVEVDGDHTYQGGVVFTRPGTETDKIIIRGKRINGNSPVISGDYNGVAFTTLWPFTGPGGHHYIFEGFEVAEAEFRVIFHQARDLTIRDCFVRDCLAHGLLGADQGSGSLLLEYTEIARCGAGNNRHQICMATDEVNNPGSVFRMQHCYLHSGSGAVFRIFDALESLEIQNNVLFNPTGNMLFKRTVKADCVSGQEVISGKNNWVKTGVQELSAQLTGTIIGVDPGFVDAQQFNLHLTATSSLVNAGVLPTVSPPG